MLSFPRSPLHNLLLKLLLTGFLDYILPFYVRIFLNNIFNCSYNGHSMKNLSKVTSRVRIFVNSLYSKKRSFKIMTEEMPGKF